MTQTVADTLVGVLEHIGVKQIFALIGDSLNPLADAVRSSSIEWIGVRHEEGAALAASGQAKFTGRLAVCAGTTGPGSTHLVAGLYEAARDHAPVLALSGDMPRKMQGVDYFQTTKPDLLFRDVSLYTETIMSPEQAPAVIHQAIAALGPNADGLAYVDFIKGKTFASPRGQFMIDPVERDIIQDVDIRRVEKVDGKLANVVIGKVGMVKDPWKIDNPPKGN